MATATRYARCLLKFRPTSAFQKHGLTLSTADLTLDLLQPGYPASPCRRSRWKKLDDHKEVRCGLNTFQKAKVVGVVGDAGGISVVEVDASSIHETRFSVGIMGHA